MYFHNPDERDFKELVPGIRARTFWGERMLVAVVDIAPNAVLPNHSHPHEQAGTMIEGQMEMTIAGQSRTLKAGDVWVIPGGVEHSAVGGDAGARVIEFFSPVREDYKY
ncbi:MAG TPA: cupin domain-containing protein [Ardenticatenaceae bacterium]|nr:cupin domain-containing protein [Ardenticatenaceae bacterium]